MRRDGAADQGKIDARAVSRTSAITMFPSFSAKVQAGPGGLPSFDLLETPPGRRMASLRMRDRRVESLAGVECPYGEK